MESISVDQLGLSECALLSRSCTLNKSMRSSPKAPKYTTLPFPDGDELMLLRQYNWNLGNAEKGRGR